MELSITHWWIFPIKKVLKTGILIILKTSFFRSYRVIPSKKFQSHLIPLVVSTNQKLRKNQSETPRQPPPQRAMAAARLPFSTFLVCPTEYAAARHSQRKTTNGNLSGPLNCCKFSWKTIINDEKWQPHANRNMEMSNCRSMKNCDLTNSQSMGDQIKHDQTIKNKGSLNPQRCG